MVGSTYSGTGVGDGEGVGVAVGSGEGDGEGVGVSVTDVAAVDASVCFTIEAEPVGSLSTVVLLLHEAPKSDAERTQMMRRPGRIFRFMRRPLPYIFSHAPVYLSKSNGSVSLWLISE